MLQHKVHEYWDFVLPFLGQTCELPATSWPLVVPLLWGIRVLYTGDYSREEDRHLPQATRCSCFLYGKVRAVQWFHSNNTKGDCSLHDLCLAFCSGWSWMCCKASWQFQKSVCLYRWSSGTKCSLDLVKSFMDYGPFCVYLQVNFDEPGTKPTAKTSQTHEVMLRIQCPIHRRWDVRYYCCLAKMHGSNLHTFVVTFLSSNLWGTNLFRLFASPQAEIPNVRIHVLIVELGSLGRNRFDGFPWLKTPYRFWVNDWFI